MSKFSSVIEAARKSHTATEAPMESRVTVKTETQQPIKTGIRQTVKKGNGETGNAGSPKPVNMGSGENGSTEKRKNVFKASHEAVNTESREPIRTSNLTVTIPTAHRNFWVGEARKRGTTVTAVIVEALTAKLGFPD